MICERCGKEHDGSFGSGKYCSVGCANKRIISNNMKDKISKSLYSYYDSIGRRGRDKNICLFCGENKNVGNHELCKKHQSVKWYKNLIPFGFDYNKIGTIEFFDEYKKAIDLLIYEYNQNLSPKDIYDKYNCSLYINNSETILHILKGLGVRTRGWSEATINSFVNCKLKVTTNSPYKSMWHTTWNGREVYLRSSYEYDYACELDSLKIDYDVECMRIKYFDTQEKRYRCAIPDFYLFLTNTIVEIKSNHTLDVQNMKDKFFEYKKLGYNCKLICEHNEIDVFGQMDSSVS